MSQQLQDYINQARASGMSDEKIRSELLSSGWQAGDINSAFGISPTASSNNIDENPETFINKWSWGGLILNWIYFAASRSYKKAVLYFLGMFVPVLNIWLWIKSGLKGRKIVWESGKWQDFESYQKRQKLLDKIGLVVVLVAVLVLLGSFVVGYFSSNKNLPNESPIVSQEILPSQSTIPTVTLSSLAGVLSTSPKSNSNIPLEVIQAISFHIDPYL